MKELKSDLDTWLAYYNNERPHRGYRNPGRRPIATIEADKQLVPKEAASASIPEKRWLSGRCLTFTPEA